MWQESFRLLGAVVRSERGGVPGRLTPEGCKTLQRRGTPQGWRCCSVRAQRPKTVGPPVVLRNRLSATRRSYCVPRKSISILARASVTSPDDQKLVTQESDLAEMDFTRRIDMDRLKLLRRME